MDIDTSGAKPECLNCGARLPAGTTRCPVCGTWANTEPQQRRCPNCGTPAAQQAQDCLMCGAPLEEVARFLVGYDAQEERPCTIVDVQFIKDMDFLRNEVRKAGSED